MNCYNNLNIGLYETYVINPWKWLEIGNTLNVFYNNNTSLLPTVFRAYKNMSASIRSNNRVSLNPEKTWSLSANYVFWLPNYHGPYQFKTMSNLGIGARALFFDKKLSCYLYVDDIFRTLKVQDISYFNNISSTFMNYEYRRSINLTVQYNFGSNNIKAKKITTGNEEERRRL